MTMTRQEEINTLCSTYNKETLAHELMIAYDLIALYQEQIAKQNEMFYASHGYYECRSCGQVERKDIGYDNVCPKCGSNLIYNSREASSDYDI